jgi:hypothetical protein
MNLNGNNPLIADQSRFTIRLENNRALHERNQRCAVIDIVQARTFRDSAHENASAKT